MEQVVFVSFIVTLFIFLILETPRPGFSRGILKFIHLSVLSPFNILGGT